jgi:cysteine desulfurase/selenocysteine lyase
VQYEQARIKVAQYMHVRNCAEVIFTHGTTEGINFIATVLARTYLQAGDEIVITQLEHHSNIIPWQYLTQTHGTILKIIPVLHDGTLDISVAASIITKKTKLVSVAHISNAIGTHVDVETLRAYARSVGAYFLVDAAQSAPHMLVNVQKIDPDFLVFSGHKLGGPTGIGILYIKEELHNRIEPYQFGGGMVFTVGQQKSQWLPSPNKYEAGTPAIAEAIGLGAAIDYLQNNCSPESIQTHTAALCAKLIQYLSTCPNIRILGSKNDLSVHGHIVSFVHQMIHAHDIAAYLGQHGVCVRAGHHCAQPLAQALDYQASVRISFYIYNTQSDVDTIICLLQNL